LAASYKLSAQSIQRIVVLGATSGIVQPLLRMFAKDGKELLLVARSQDRLEALRTDLLARGAREVLTLQADLVKTPESVVSFAKEQFPNFDTVFLAYGTMLDQEMCQVSAEYAVRELHTNFVSAVSLLTLFAGYFESRRSGTIAAITSVAGDRGRRSNYVYGAAKGGLTIFLQGLRARMEQFGVRVLTIKPGPVATAMTAGKPDLPLLAAAEHVAADIYNALKNQRPEVIYTPARWRWIMAALHLVPESVFKKLPI
jgi:decaprenylphospho-beta-D-erythro-pentofuranosid-2-ulose 2-reductase